MAADGTAAVPAEAANAKGGVKKADKKVATTKRKAKEGKKSLEESKKEEGRKGAKPLYAKVRIELHISPPKIGGVFSSFFLSFLSFGNPENHHHNPIAT